MPEWLTILIGFAGTLAMVAGGWLTARSSNRSSPYDKLAERVVALETADEEKSKRIARLERELRVVTSDLEIVTDALWQQAQWIAGGAQPPPPTISPSALDVIHRRRSEPLPSSATSPIHWSE